MEESKISKYIPVQMYVRVTRKDNEPRERALLIAKSESGVEYIFTYEDLDGELQDLIVCNKTEE